MAVAARAASRALQALSTADRVAILKRIADALEAQEAAVMAANAADVAAAGADVAPALLQRLGLKPNKISQLAGGCQGQGGRQPGLWNAPPPAQQPRWALDRAPAAALAAAQTASEPSRAWRSRSASC